MAQNMTDAELDRDWVPNGRRPQSTIARSFSAELMDIFRIENSVADLDEKVVQRKQTVQTQTNELEALERRIREMEERLKSNGPAQKPAERQAAHDAVAALSKEAEKVRSRPGTARQNQPHAPSSANMPPTPTASEGEYEFVGKDDLDDDPPRH
ncbi:hypothetical protein CGCF415_v006678 [Colletotrichum fructicola]|uniref:Uncharacterized protein n=6 Tax=Colletotrichum gloeosporioides species complex TaxID=2707338 RepID=A0A9W4S602_9PEZI|nr:uncharacterized protein CGCS363_v003244 [Colletotrichum siamense]XP_037182952.1 uncharacterized protein CGCA056_v002731 [Colletotrichum aenigma]XP_053034452.1 uncharacterized protein COL26b_008819 [Colletotrichum chrysophilum]KAF0324734.1 hypothetical protein GQ607_007905 [Colletotrichum asianum]KAF4822856.1 hypothetical protein CGCTS75_v010602 [Colletotrichum tropicale]KAF4892933.1 hypothetical protein CGCFRS4_v007382 [Colletotrichum fructicola]KAF4919014.1 hypothetical protein CGCVW01_v0